MCVCVLGPLCQICGYDETVIFWPFWTASHRTQKQFLIARVHTHARTTIRSKYARHKLAETRERRRPGTYYFRGGSERARLFVSSLSLSLSLSLSFDASWRKKRRRTHRWILIYSLSLTHTHTHTIFLSLGNIHAGYRERVAKTPV